MNYGKNIVNVKSRLNKNYVYLNENIIDPDFGIILV